MEKHRVRSGAQTITMTVPHKPARAGIDPRHLLVDWDVEMDDSGNDNNIQTVKTKN